MSGMLKKMVFANFLSTLLCDPVFADPSRYHSMEVLLATIGYSVVMYCDFSGYSDMAIGVALLLGFKTPANFNRPYCSFSVTEFWKRWHITFSSWLREYLYFSMGGSRFGLVHTLVALFFTMILGGLWHGASITFIVWGAMQGLALVLERAFNYGNKRNANIIITAIQVLVTFAFTTISWIVFRSANLEEVRTLFQSSGNFSAGITLLTPVVWILLVTGLLMHAIPDKMRADGFEIWCAIPLPVKGILIALFFVLLSVVSMSGIAPFIYFQF
jgi:D-alanyl-lipoteichoic acid acyltransferase DltB (MBOAT superfamily)